MRVEPTGSSLKAAAIPIAMAGGRAVTAADDTAAPMAHGTEASIDLGMEGPTAHGMVTTTADAMSLAMGGGPKAPPRRC